MQLTIVAAMSRNNVIGREQGLPWKLPEDLKRFRALTMGKWIVMGRRTYESIGRPLPGRKNIVLTHQAAYQAPGCYVAHCLVDAIRLARPSGELMVIGGETVYREALQVADRIILTTIELDVQGDAHFPCLNMSDWVQKDRQVFDASIRHTVVVMERRKVAALARRRKISSRLSFGSAQP